MSIMHSEEIAFSRKRHYSFGALSLYLTFAVTLRQVKEDFIKATLFINAICLKIESYKASHQIASYEKAVYLNLFSRATFYRQESLNSILYV